MSSNTAKSATRKTAKRKAKKTKRVAAKKIKMTPENKKRAEFLKQLIDLSMKEAARSKGALKDIFLQQALRLDAELEKMESHVEESESVKGNA